MIKNPFSKMIPVKRAGLTEGIGADIERRFNVDNREVLPDPNGWVRFGTHVWAPEVAERWRSYLRAEALKPASGLTKINTRIGNLLDGLGKFYLAMNLKPSASPQYVRPYTAAFGVAPPATEVVGVNGGLVVLASAAESGMRGSDITYIVPAGVNDDGSVFRSDYTYNPMRAGSPCDVDDGTCVYTQNKAGVPKKVIPSPTMTLELLKSVVDGLDDQTLQQMLTDARGTAIQQDPSYPPPGAPLDVSIGHTSLGGGSIDPCRVPVVTSRAEAEAWNRANPSCPPVIFDPGRRTSCTYRGEPMTTQAQVDAWNRANPECRLPDLNSCIPSQPLTTEFEIAAWRASHPWCSPTLYRPLSGGRPEEQDSSIGTLLMLAGAGAIVYMMTRSK